MDEHSDSSPDKRDQNKAEYADTSTEEILDEYHQFATSVLDRSENTVDLHTRYIERLLEHVDKPPSQVTQDDIAGYLDSEGDVSDTARMNIIGALRVFFRDFFDRGVIDAFEMPSKSAKPTDVPSKNDLQTFYEALENLKYKTAFLFAATSGLRSSELCQLTMDDIDEDKRTLVSKRTVSAQCGPPTFDAREAATLAYAVGVDAGVVLLSEREARQLHDVTEVWLAELKSPPLASRSGAVRASHESCSRLALCSHEASPQPLRAYLARLERTHRVAQRQQTIIQARLEDDRASRRRLHSLSPQ